VTGIEAKPPEAISYSDIGWMTLSVVAVLVATWLSTRGHSAAVETASHPAGPDRRRPDRTSSRKPTW
ncbi:hypothetical protein J7I98_40515, partial [Streptomyces sp. ISL-98]|uniref:hypothetical protein n=1 Tax=Streptomyces sp. ISL-98 TaxID=2819192 RepID=UPI001BE540BE